VDNVAEAVQTSVLAEMILGHFNGIHHPKAKAGVFIYLNLERWGLHH
jgi:hypothetical protein